MNFQWEARLRLLKKKVEKESFKSFERNLGHAQIENTDQKIKNQRSLSFEQSALIFHRYFTAQARQQSKCSQAEGDWMLTSVFLFPKRHE